MAIDLYYAWPTTTYGTLVDLLIYANTSTDNMFGISTVLSIFLISYMVASKRWSVELSFAGASFLASMTSYFLAVVGALGSHLIVIPTAMFLASSIFLIMKN